MIVTFILKSSVRLKRFASLVLLKTNMYLFQDVIKQYDVIIWFKALEMQSTFNTKLSNESPISFD